jgi:hypothetical protein
VTKSDQSPFTDKNKTEHPVLGRNVILIGPNNFTNKYRLAAAIYAECQHLGGRGDSQSLQDELDDFIDKYIIDHPEMTQTDKQAMYALPPHYDTTPRQR